MSDLRNMLLNTYGSSKMDLIEDYVAGNVSQLTLAAEIGSSGMDLVNAYKKECAHQANTNLVYEIKKTYMGGELVMSELLRTYDNLSVREKRELLAWAGEDDHAVVLSDGRIEAR